MGKKIGRRRAEDALLILRAIRAGVGRLDAPAHHLEVGNALFAINLDDADGWILSDYAEIRIREALRDA